MASHNHAHLSQQLATRSSRPGVCSSPSTPIAALVPEEEPCCKVLAVRVVQLGYTSAPVRTRKTSSLRTSAECCCCAVQPFCTPCGPQSNVLDGLKSKRVTRASAKSSVPLFIHDHSAASCCSEHGPICH
jgi:hypothetical protein